MRQKLVTLSWEAVWLLPLLLVSAAHLSLAWALHLNRLAPAPLLKTYSGTSLLILSAILLGWVLWQLVGAVRTCAPSPITYLRDAARRVWPRTIAALIGLQLFALGSSGASILKGAIPVVSPFWFDVPVAQFERAALGMDPWELSHQLFGWATPAIDVAYAAWLPIEMLTLYVVLFSTPGRDKATALTCQALVWLILGSFAWIFSSAGPIFYDRVFEVARFSVDLSNAPIAHSTSEMLWRHYVAGTAHLGTGISAAPSLHVAITIWMAIVARGTRLAPIVWLYAAIVFIGSIHLGWHYVFDGLFAMAATPLIWLLSRRIVDYLQGLIVSTATFAPLRL